MKPTLLLGSEQTKLGDVDRFPNMFDDVTLFDGVRTSCRRVVERGDMVALNRPGLDRLAAEARSMLDPPSPGTVAFHEGRAMASLAANAINFGSGYHDLIRKEPGLSGAQTMLARLTSYLDATGPLSVDRLLRFTVEDCSQIFGQEMDGGAVEELLSRFAMALNDLGEFIGERGGTAHSVLHRAGQSAESLAVALTAMPYYRDVDRHQSEPVWFYKRAQITPADLARQGLWHFTDLDRLTAFADNLVPHVLRLDGAIDVAPAVVDAIGRGERLEPGSPAELELRASAVVAVDEIVARIDNPRVWAMHVDEWLWRRGGAHRYKAAPRPRSRSVFY
ncbi:MAG: queuosine salvage family protein [Acidimicrobiia bacterium]|nr:queuosine salvage family protein [Acidimicrobiia bacterium]